MKTVEDFYQEIAASKALREELHNTPAKKLATFLKKHDCGASAKEFTAYMQASEEGEIKDDDAAAVAGGVPLFAPRPKQ